MNKILLILILTIILTISVSATTLQGTVYDENLAVERDVLIEIDSTPAQKYLSKDGSYSFELPQGTYTLTARKGFTTVSEEVNIVTDGTYTFDLFLLPDFTDEDELWQDSDEILFANGEENVTTNRRDYEWWRYALAGVVIIFALWRFGKVRKKYGKLPAFRRKMKAESKKTIEQHKADLAKEPGYIDRALDIIKKHDGRITQKELRKEMLYLSEAKVSLIVTELEHRGKIEKVKKGRGNVILLK